MKEGTATVVMAIGFLLTAFGVGGVEQSLDDASLLAGVAVSTVGLLIMYCGVLGLRNSEYY